LAIARVTQTSDAKRPVVDEVAEEDRAPVVGGIGLQRREETLDVAVDVADLPVLIVGDVSMLTGSRQGGIGGVG